MYKKLLNISMYGTLIEAVIIIRVCSCHNGKACMSRGAVTIESTKVCNCLGKTLSSPG